LGIYLPPKPARVSYRRDSHLLKVLAADLKDSCFIVRLTGVSIKNGTDDKGSDNNIIKVCMKVHYIVEIPNLGAFIKVKKAAPEDTFSGASFDSFTNGKSGHDFYKELMDGKVSALTITTPKKEKKGGKKALTDGAVDEAVAKIKKSKASTSKGDDESPLKKSKKDEAFAEDAISDAKLADEMIKLMDGKPHPR